MQRLGTSRLTTAACVALVLFVVAFRVALVGRAETDAHIDDGQRFRFQAVLGFVHALKHDDLYPPLDLLGTGLRYAPNTVSDGFVFNEKLLATVGYVPPAVVFGRLDGFPAYTLRPLIEPKEYFYLGYAVRTESEALSLVSKLDAKQKVGESPDGEIPADPGEGSFGTDTYLPLIEKFADHLEEAGSDLELPNDFAATIPLVIQRPTPGPNAGGWVVYFDRHLEYIAYPGPFPMTKSLIEAMERLDRFPTPDLESTP